MRFFYTGNASFPFPISGGKFITFEQLRLSGGSWKGVYATNDEKIIGVISKISNIREISEDDYQDLKKNKRGLNPNFSFKKPVIPSVPKLDVAQKKIDVVVDSIEDLVILEDADVKDPLDNT
jgi:hypothetical protein